MINRPWGLWIGRLWANLPLTTKGVVVVALPLSILLLALVSIYLASLAEAEAEDAVRAAFVIERDIHAAYALLAEAASGVRGYLLTGQERFLEPNTKADAELPAILARLDANIRDPVVRAGFERVKILVDQKQEGLTDLRAYKDNPATEGTSQTEVLTALVANKEVLDGLRSQIDAMQVREAELLAQRQARADSVRARNLSLTAISGLVGVLGSIAAVYLFSTGIVGRVRLLEMNAGRLERGEQLEPLPAEADAIGRLAVKLDEASQLLRTREQALRDGEERFRLVIEGVRDYGIFALDREGRVVSWNAGAERIKGWHADEILGQHFSTFYPPETRAALPKRMLEIATAEGRAEDESWRIRKDGTRFWADVVVTALRDETGRLRGFSKVTRDMTERKVAEEALREAREAAMTASQAKSEFLSRTSHELRTPLSAILGFTQLLELDEADLKSPQRKAVQRILQAGRHLLALINEVLDISSIEAGKVEFDIDVINLTDALREAFDLSLPIANEANVKLEWTINQKTALVRADRRRLVQVALNLLSNAIKYNRTNGVVQIKITDVGDMMRVDVLDEGPGVSAQVADRLFTPFDRLGRERTAGVDGTGLGLALSRRLVEAMGGEIGFQNRPSSARGAQFWFSLPKAAGA